MNLEKEYKEQIVICFRGQDTEKDLLKLGYHLNKVENIGTHKVPEKKMTYINKDGIMLLHYPDQDNRIIYLEPNGFEVELDLYFRTDEHIMVK